MNRPQFAPRPQLPVPRSSITALILASIDGTADSGCVPCLVNRTNCSTLHPRCIECQKRNTACFYTPTSPPTFRIRAEPVPPFSMSSKIPFVAKNKTLKRKHDYSQDLGRNVAIEEDPSERLEMKSDQVIEEVGGRIREGGIHALLEQVENRDLKLPSLGNPDAHLEPLNQGAKSTPSSDSYQTSKLYKHTLGGPNDESHTHASGQHQFNRLDKGNPPKQYTNFKYTPSHPTARILDNRFSSPSFKISRWTDLSSDEGVLRKLLESYLLNDYPLTPVLHKDAFISELASGNSDFCSRLLVNSVLAAGCTHAQTEGEQGIGGGDFRAEARRLWDQEMGREGQQKITTVQAAMILSAIHASEGDGQTASEYWEQGMAVAKKLDLFEDPEKDMGDAVDGVDDMDGVEGDESREKTHTERREKMHKERREKSKRVRTVTAWGIFGLQTSLSFRPINTPLLIEPPKSRLPNRSDAAQFFGEVWVKYEGSEVVQPLYLGLMFLARAELSSLRTAIVRELNSKEDADTKHRKGMTLEEAGRFYAKLESWQRNLPLPLRSENVLLPSLLLLHIHFRALVLHTFTPLLEVEAIFTPEDGSSAFTDYVDYSPKKIVQEARENIDGLLDVWGENYGSGRHGVVGRDVLSCALPEVFVDRADGVTVSGENDDRQTHRRKRRDDRS